MWPFPSIKTVVNVVSGWTNETFFWILSYIHKDKALQKSIEKNKEAVQYWTEVEEMARAQRVFAEERAKHIENLANQQHEPYYDIHVRLCKIWAQDDIHDAKEIGYLYRLTKGNKTKMEELIAQRENEIDEALKKKQNNDYFLNQYPRDWDAEKFVRSQKWRIFSQDLQDNYNKMWEEYGPIFNPKLNDHWIYHLEFWDFIPLGVAWWLWYKYSWWRWYRIQRERGAVQKVIAMSHIAHQDVRKAVITNWTVVAAILGMYLTSTYGYPGMQFVWDQHNVDASIRYIVSLDLLRCNEVILSQYGEAAWQVYLERIEGQTLASRGTLDLDTAEKALDWYQKFREILEHLYILNAENLEKERRFTTKHVDSYYALRLAFKNYLDILGVLDYSFFSYMGMLIALPLIGALFLIFYSLCTYKENFRTYYTIGLVVGVFSSFISLYFRFTFKILEIQNGFLNFILYLVPQMGRGFLFKIDGISVFFFILINFFTYLTIYSLHENVEEALLAIICLLILQWSLIGSFLASDLLGFFIFFEITLMPIFFLVLNLGSRDRRIRAVYLIAVFTMLGSILILFNALYMGIKCSDLFELSKHVRWSSGINDFFMLWDNFFIGFGVKMPVFPLHLWLPEAHVEAPTVGSVVLAALLLKLGSYGIFRFCFIILMKITFILGVIAICLGLLGIIYTALTAIAQIDLKKIIAYSSVGHMSMVLLGLLAFSSDAVQGAFFQMFSHGVVSGALFFCVGSLYERFKVRSLKYYGGLTFFFPLLALVSIIFFMANISFPLTSSFIGEFLILMGLFKHNFVVTFFAATSMVLGAIYMLWTFNRIFFGNIKIFLLIMISDLSRKEFFLYTLLLFFLFLMGINPNFILDTLLFQTTKYMLFK